MTDFDVLANFETMMRELEEELPLMKWERGPGALKRDGEVNMNHYIGRGPKWTIQLVILDSGQRMGAATAGTVVMKLTDELCGEAEAYARAGTR